MTTLTTEYKVHRDAQRKRRIGESLTGSVEILVENLSGGKLDEARILRALRAVLKAEKIKRGEWRINVVKDAAMKRLHRNSMNDPTTADVLTFDLRDLDCKAGSVDLDTVVCYDVAKREAKRRGHGVTDELLLYMVHSLLHVCGYDDLNEKAAARMHRREDELLERIGIGAVYAHTKGR
jgi:rRNA maturation RNase YbeY